MAKCNDENCSVSTGICGNMTYGQGSLDDYGYWEYSCKVCDFLDYFNEWPKNSPLPRSSTLS